MIYLFIILNDLNYYKLKTKLQQKRIIIIIIINQMLFTGFKKQTQTFCLKHLKKKK